MRRSGIQKQNAAPITMLHLENTITRYTEHCYKLAVRRKKSSLGINAWNITTSMEPCLFTREFRSTVKKRKGRGRKKYTQTKKTDTYKEQTVNYQYPQKECFFPITAKLSLLQNKIEVVMIIMAWLLVSGPQSHWRFRVGKTETWWCLLYFSFSAVNIENIKKNPFRSKKLKDFFFTVKLRKHKWRYLNRIN